MTHRWIGSNTYRRLAVPLVGLLVAFAIGCGLGSDTSDKSPDAATAPVAPGGAVGGAESDVGRELAQLRAVTARFQSFEVASSAGYSAQITGCMTDPTLGGMGFHYGKPSAIDNVADPLEPEVLLYEPQQNGRLRLVAVEFILPYSVRPRNGPVPQLFGRPFIQNDAFELWGLHAWVWRNNPAGMFADWNPQVNCDAVPEAARMSHSGH
jgi:hypothetical protein